MVFALCWYTGKTRSAPGLFFLLGAAAVVAILIVIHERVLDRLDVCKRRCGLYRRGLDRLEDRWSGSGEKGNEFYDRDHLYAEDLDIFGDNSLYQLLCTCRTLMGKRLLAAWLLGPAPLDVVQQRQLAVRELRDKLDFKEQLAIVGGTDHIRSDPVVLTKWAIARTGLNRRLWWIVAIILAVASLVSFAYAWVGSWLPFLNILLVCAIVSSILRRQVNLILTNIGGASCDLSLLALLMRCIEQEKFETPILQVLQQKLANQTLVASECVGKLGWIADFEKSRLSLIGRAIDRPLMYSVQLACALETWRNAYGQYVGTWLDAVGEIESLVALSTYCFEHPEDPFPEFLPASDCICIHGHALAHPLRPTSSFVSNDIALDQQCRILLVSGSNMSGKSTFLRVVGINVVLAMMGAPARAGKLQLSPVSIGATIRVSDSLQEGVSRFYAEIKRIRNIVELSSRTPTLFLFDEILQGTNSHDRRAGAEALVKSLLRYQAIGLVTTHDLALTELQKLSNRIRNVHFQETLEAGKLSFDYRLHQGVVTTSNGIELMRSIGLDV